MKAHPIKGLHPHRPLDENAQIIVATRLDELYRFLPRALDPEQPEALHDMRIAAKRLRYVLELTGFCFGPYAATATRHARELQELIGEVHDCDVMLPRIRGHLEERRRAAARSLAATATDPDALTLTDAGAAGDGDVYRALELLTLHYEARRIRCFARFCRRWASLERAHWRSRLQEALTQAPEARVPTTPALVEESA